MPRQTFTRSGRTAASIESVWAALQRPATWEAIPGVDRVFEPVIDSEGTLQGFGFESLAAGKKYLGQATPAGRAYPRSMAWEIRTSEIHGVIGVELAVGGVGTDVVVDLSIESVGALSSVFFPVIAGAIGSGFAKAVDEFVASFE